MRTCVHTIIFRKKESIQVFSLKKHCPYDLPNTFIFLSNSLRFCVNKMRKMTIKMATILLGNLVGPLLVKVKNFLPGNVQPLNSCTDIKFFFEVSEGEDDYGDFNDDRGVDTDAHGQLLDKIDAYSFRIFPFVFLVTNIPFWCYYIIFSPANCS